jgi:two-component system, OmpR family, phosphate regulon response regulator OmpR
MEKENLLIVDDDKRIRELLSKYLSDNGFSVQEAENALIANDLLKSQSFDLMVLDVMMPKKSGFEFSKELREEGNDIPILFLTAKTEVDDRIHGLELGADDYLPKPFEPKELVLRINAILRRHSESKEVLSFGDYTLDDTNMILMNNDGRKTYLNNIETNFLRVLIKAHGEPVSREELLDKSRLIVEFRTIDVQIMRLRQKIENDPKNPQYLKTIRGKGYVLEG